MRSPINRDGTTLLSLMTGMVLFQDRTNYRVPDSAPWKDVGTLLSNRFSQATGQGLSKEDLHYLACKAFGKYMLPGLEISWSREPRAPLNGFLKFLQGCTV